MNLENLALLFDQMPGGIWTTDLDLRYTSSGGKEAKSFKKNHPNYLGMTLQEFFKTDSTDYPAIRGHLKALKGEIAEYILHWEGEYYQCHVSPLYDETKKLIGTIGHAANITEQRKEEFSSIKKRSEQAARYQRGLLLLTKMDYGHLDETINKILKVTSETLNVERISFWLYNKKRSEITCKSMFCLSQEQFRSGYTLKALDYPRYFKALEESRHLAANDARLDPRTSEFQDYLKSFDIYSMMDVAVRLQGNIIGIVCHEHTRSHRDWSKEDQEFATSIADMLALALETHEHQKAKQALQQKTQALQKSNRELERFAYVASHDLQEPLNLIVAFSERCRSLIQKNTEPRLIDYLSRIENSALRMHQLTNDLLQYARISTRKRPFEEVDLNLIVSEVISDLQIKLQEKKTHIESSHLPTVRGDSSKIHRLFLNLLSNSLKFSEKNRPTEISIASENISKEFTKISIKDNGIGFESKFNKKIFTPLLRLHNQEEYTGSGMGLTICEKIVQVHGGKIEASSQKNQGTKIDFTLPRTHQVKKSL